MSCISEDVSRKCMYPAQPSHFPVGAAFLLIVLPPMVNVKLIALTLLPPVLGSSTFYVNNLIELSPTKPAGATA
jgi:hypothetical protein